MNLISSTSRLDSIIKIVLTVSSLVRSPSLCGPKFRVVPVNDNLGPVQSIRGTPSQKSRDFKVDYYE